MTEQQEEYRILGVRIDYVLSKLKVFMFLRPEYVAECFLKLVETGKNGDVMIVSEIFFFP